MFYKENALRFKISGVIPSCTDIKGLKINEEYDLFTFHKYRQKCKERDIGEIYKEREEDKI